MALASRPLEAAAMPVASLDDAIVSIAWLAAVPSMTSALDDVIGREIASGTDDRAATAVDCADDLITA